MERTIKLESTSDESSEAGGELLLAQRINRPDSMRTVPDSKPHHRYRSVTPNDLQLSNMSGQYPRQPGSNPNFPYDDPRTNPNWPYPPGVNANHPGQQYPTAQGHQGAGPGYPQYPPQQVAPPGPGYSASNTGYGYSVATGPPNTAYNQPYTGQPYTGQPYQGAGQAQAYQQPMNPISGSGAYYGAGGQAQYPPPGTQAWPGQAYGTPPPAHSEPGERSSTGSNSSPHSSESSQGSGDPALDAKRLRNTISARRGRARKLEELEELQTQVNTLRSQVTRMETDKNQIAEDLVNTNAAVAEQRRRNSEQMRALQEEESSGQ